MGSSLKLLLFRRKWCSSVTWVPYKWSLNGEGWFGFFLNLQVVRAGSLRPKNEWRNSTTIPTCLFGPFTSVDSTLQPPPILWPPAQKERLSPNLTSTVPPFISTNRTASALHTFFTLHNPFKVFPFRELCHENPHQIRPQKSHLKPIPRSSGRFLDVEGAKVAARPSSSKNANKTWWVSWGISRRTCCFF